MSTHWLFLGADDLVPAVAIACFNLIVALALVTVGLLVVIAVSSVSWLNVRPKGFQLVHRRAGQSMQR